MNKTNIKYVPFSLDMAKSAAQLLAHRHGNDRELLPLLPQKYETTTIAEQALNAVLQSPGASGMAAFDGNRMLGYLVGNLTINSIRGRHVWIHPAGFSMAESVDPDLYRMLYSRLGTGWVQKGFFDHFILGPANPAQLDPWFRSGFAYEQAYALLDLNQFDPSELQINSEIKIRQASKKDKAKVQSFSSLISVAHAGAPVWGVSLPEDTPERREGYGELLDEKGTTTWLGSLDREAVGIHVYRTLQSSDTTLLVPDGSLQLTVASTKPAWRHQGVSTSLLVHGLSYGKQQGFRYCETDWRVTHLLSSRHWPNVGFVPVAYRLVRKVDPRIVWANGQEEVDLHSMNS